MNLGDDGGSTSPIVNRPIIRKATNEGKRKCRGRNIDDVSVVAERFVESQAQIQKIHGEKMKMPIIQDKKVFALAEKT